MNKATEKEIMDKKQEILARASTLLVLGAFIMWIADIFIKDAPMLAIYVAMMFTLCIFALTLSLFTEWSMDDHAEIL